jgi:beta-galactosidase
MRALSYQAIARGADGVMFFQWRQSRRGGERFHSAMVPHAGPDTRIWDEVEALGAELGLLASIAGTQPARADVAILLDWDSWWALDQPALPARVDYPHAIAAWHHALLDLGLTVDFVSADGDPTGYRVLIVPHLLVTADGVAERLDRFVRSGGHLLVTFLSGATDEDAALSPGGLVGPFAGLLGVMVEEFAPHDPDERVAVEGEVSGTTGIWAELVHPDGAAVLARFAGGFADGSPAVTRRPLGDGVAWYLATDLDPVGAGRLLELVTDGAGVRRGAAAGLPDVEVVRRGRWVFAINHGAEASALALTGRDAITGAAVTRVELPPFGVHVLESSPTETGRDGARAPVAVLTA